MVRQEMIIRDNEGTSRFHLLVWKYRFESMEGRCVCVFVLVRMGSGALILGASLVACDIFVT